MRLHAGSSVNPHSSIFGAGGCWADGCLSEPLSSGHFAGGMFTRSYGNLSPFFSSISKVSDQFVLIIGLPLKIHLKKSMTLALRKKAGLDKQMLQTIKYCQKARTWLFPYDCPWLQSDPKGIGSVWDRLRAEEPVLDQSDRVFYCNITLIYSMDIVWTWMA